MRICVPTETAPREQRVALAPDSVGRLIKQQKLDVVVERGAGLRAGFRDDAYEAAGASIAPDVASTYREAQIDVFHLAGARDEFYPPERVKDYERQLQTRARSVQFKSYDAGHEIIPEMRPDVVQWLTVAANER